MTGYVTSCMGVVSQLPELLEWDIMRTDGTPCDSFTVRFALISGWKNRLYEAVYFSAEENGETVFTGVVDEVCLQETKDGRIAEVSGRGMAAKLIDTQVKAAEFLQAQLQDILNAYVKPCGIGKIKADKLGTVGNFVAETGYSCWQVLTGFCRHGGGVFPYFLADGTLVLQKNPEGRKRVLAGNVLRAEYRDSRYDTIAKQIIVPTGSNPAVTASNTEFIARGGTSVRAVGRSGQKLRATWRTAEQRIEDAAREASEVIVELPGTFLAQPQDIVALALPGLEISGSYRVSSVQSHCDENGKTCTLTLRK